MPEEQSQIFRKVALDRLSSPEQLDHLMKVTSPKGWLALVAVAGVLVTALIWGVLGSIPTAVNGQGILIRGGSVYDVVSVGAGVVTQIYVRPNQIIAEGFVVARISQPELELRIRNTQLELEDLVEQHQKLIQSEGETLRIDVLSMTQERTNLLAAIKNYDEQIAALERKMAKQEEALAKGLIIDAALLATQIEIFTAQQGRAQARLKLTQLGAGEVDRPMQVQQQQNNRRQRIEDTMRSLNLLKKSLELTSVVKSPYAGRVLELTVDQGNMVTAGARILSVERTDRELEAVVFVPAADGKRVLRNMTVRISPSTVKKEEAGYILGRVNAVLPFPSTPEGMMRVLRNNELVRQLAGYGASIEVHVTLEKDGGGYLWSSAQATQPAINSGTLCTCSIIVATDRPISLLIPMFKGALQN